MTCELYDSLYSPYKLLVLLHIVCFDSMMVSYSRECFIDFNYLPILSINLINPLLVYIKVQKDENIKRYF
jgi:hypothetical protein